MEEEAEHSALGAAGGAPCSEGRRPRPSAAALKEPAVTSQQGKHFDPDYSRMY